MRKRRDSNPRAPYGANSLARSPFQPLRHSSFVYYTIYIIYHPLDKLSSRCYLYPQVIISISFLSKIVRRFELVYSFALVIKLGKL